ncbi:MAG: DUF1501 domain-containing protein [Planctomycetaceae bacterium]
MNLSRITQRQQLCSPGEHTVSRRQLLGTAAGVGGLSGLLDPIVAEELKQNEKQVLFVWLDGGISQLESWDPKPHTRYGGPYRAISTSLPGIQISELLPKTAQQLHHLSLLRSVHTQDNSHSAGVGRINRGDPKNRGVVYPYLGSTVAKLLGPTSSGLPPYCWVKPYSGGFKTADAGFLPAKYGALAFGDAKAPDNLLLNESVSPGENTARNELRKKFNVRFTQGRRQDWADANSYIFDVADTLMQRRDLFDESRVPERDRDRYGRHALGRHMLMGRRLLEAGVRFVKVNSYHWDSHGDNFNACESLVPQFDQPFAALLEDLHERGMLDNVLVIAMSEFGRTPRINSHVGRDHWPEAWSVAMGGAGIRRGHVVGRTNSLGTFVDSEEYDIGHLFHTWFRALDIPETMMEFNNDGQPLPVANEDCHPIQELLT